MIGSASNIIFPLFAMFGFAVLVAGGALFLGRFLGPLKYEAVKISPYECGMPPVGAARDRISVKYYLVAILFLLFDLEAAFLLPVALAWKELSALGIVLLVLMGFFMFFFVLGLWYEFKVKALEWER
ncbi:MAG: NADH-quinone oxidoreductase subunit A [Bdellovibrionales bacterium]|nr:NADH-quinone oxidoreductase subunit A [Bdellovibrionales bacterium]